ALDHRPQDGDQRDRDQRDGRDHQTDRDLVLDRAPRRASPQIDRAAGARGPRLAALVEWRARDPPAVLDGVDRGRHVPRLRFIERCTIAVAIRLTAIVMTNSATASAISAAL